MTRARRFLWPTLAALAFALTLVALQGAGPATERHERTLEALRTLTLSESALQRDVLRARAGLLTSYDPIVEAVADLRGAALALRGAATDATGTTRVELERRVADVAAGVDRQEIECRDFQVAIRGAAELARLLQLSQRHDRRAAGGRACQCHAPLHHRRRSRRRLGGGGGTRATQSVERAGRSTDRARTPYCRNAPAGGSPCREHPGRAYRSASAGGTGDLPQRVRPRDRTGGPLSPAALRRRPGAGRLPRTPVPPSPRDRPEPEVARCHGETDRRDLDGLSRRPGRSSARASRRVSRGSADRSERIARALSWATRQSAPSRGPERSPASPRCHRSPFSSLPGAGAGPPGPTVTRR